MQSLWWMSPPFKKLVAQFHHQILKIKERTVNEKIPQISFEIWTTKKVRYSMINYVVLFPTNIYVFHLTRVSIYIPETSTETSRLINTIEHEKKLYTCFDYNISKQQNKVKVVAHVEILLFWYMKTITAMLSNIDLMWKHSSGLVQWKL